ncbi:MAG: CHC2 zinc finger domain-containing protein [archaeon]
MDTINEIKEKVPISSILQYYGVNTSSNVTSCPIGHDSKRGKCFSFNDSKNVGHCFHCEWGGDQIQLVMELEKLEFLDACRWINERYGLNLTISKSVLKIDKEPSDPYFNISKFNNPTIVYVSSKGEVYDHLSMIQKNKGIYFDREYVIYEGSVGAGNPLIYIITQDKLNLGDNKIYLRPLEKEVIQEYLDEVETKFIFYICNKLSINLFEVTEDGKRGAPKEKDIIISEIADKKYIFFEPMLPVDKEDLKHLGNGLEAAINLLRNGLKKEVILDYIYAADIPEVNPSKIPPRFYMKYSPNKIIITNQKVGKSFNALVVTGEPALERPSISGLLGFADSNTKHPGILHRRTKQTYIEELQEEKDEELFGKLHTYMEIGETKIPRGVSISVLGHSGITFQGNPKSKTELDENMQAFLMIKQFKDFLVIISRNIKPLSSRIGLVLFSVNLEKATGAPNNRDLSEKGEKIIRTIAEGFKDEFTALFHHKDIEDWLNLPFDQEYIQTIQKISDITNDTILKEFLEGQLDSYRHTRGIALRIAFLDKGIQELVTLKKIDEKNLIQSSEDHLARLQKINIESFTNIVNLLNSPLHEEIILYTLRNIRPEYIKLGIFSLLEYISEDYELKEKIIPLASLTAIYSSVKDWVGIDKDHKYRSFSTIQDYYEKFKANTNIIFDEFGLQYDSLNQSFILLDPEKIKTYRRLYKRLKGNKVTKVTPENEGHKGHKGDISNEVEEIIVTNVTSDLDQTVSKEPKLVNYKQILDTIRLRDKGDGVDIDIILNLCEDPQWAESKAIAGGKEAGEIYEPRPGRLKVLE